MFFQITFQKYRKTRSEIIKKLENMIDFLEEALSRFTDLSEEGKRLINTLE